MTKTIWEISKKISLLIDFFFGYISELKLMGSIFLVAKLWLHSSPVIETGCGRTPEKVKLYWREPSNILHMFDYNLGMLVDA